MILLCTYNIILIVLLHARYEDVQKDPDSEVKNILRGRGVIVGAIEAGNIAKQDTKTEQCFKLFTPMLYSKAIKKLNQRMEGKIGYHLVQKNLQRPQSLSISAWNLLMDTLWWIIVPTLILLFHFGIYLLWREISRQYAIYSKRSRNTFPTYSNSKPLAGKTRRNPPLSRLRY